MPKLPGINHRDAVRAFKSAGFEILRQSGHVVMAKGDCIIVLPRQNPINAITMGNIVRDAGLTVRQFRKLL